MLAADDPLEIKRSGIHGFGGFARRPMAARTLVLEYTGERIDKHESLIRCERGNHCIFFLDEQWDLDGDVKENPARFLNHNCAPSCEAERIDGHIWIVAFQDIRAGDEITFNYSYDLTDYREHPCHCGAPACVGFIVAAEFFPHLRAASRARLHIPWSEALDNPRGDAPRRVRP